ncbi:VTT domain-containing protein [Vibrio cholerae]
MDMAHTLNAWILSHPHSLGWMMIALILLSYLLEDLALVTAATLSVNQVMAVEWALLAIFIGIASGDLALYGLGRLAQRIGWLKVRCFRYHKARRLCKKLNANAFVTLFIVRFVPGMRSVSYTVSGFLGIALPVFLLAVLIATAMWTALIFASFYQVGGWIGSEDAWTRWLMIPVGLLALWALNRAAQQFWRSEQNAQS